MAIAAVVDAASVSAAGGPADEFVGQHVEPVVPAEDHKFDDRSTDPGSDRACSDDDEQDSLIIFDWDDTLFPTSWLAQRGLLFAEDLSSFTESQRNDMSKLADSVAATLTKAMMHGKVVIVTNAVAGWVQDSCLRLLPSLAAVVAEVEVFSARSAFEPTGLRSPTDWKICAFRAEVTAFCQGLSADQHVNIISAGDSVHEHCALLQATSEREQCFAKSLKFAPKPNVQLLVEEHRLAAGSFEEIMTFDGDLDIDVFGGDEAASGAMACKDAASRGTLRAWIHLGHLQRPAPSCSACEHGSPWWFPRWPRGQADAHRGGRCPQSYRGPIVRPIPGRCPRKGNDHRGDPSPPPAGEGLAGAGGLEHFAVRPSRKRENSLLWPAMRCSWGLPLVAARAGSCWTSNLRIPR
eukprot:CAMPEP_0170212508 /NCGR_PEP_ID=MMETSP0116_2-20130129/5872_1 /TAXON_ID=400756 /ORGANISM="Durinskia baltica, Strain CSIRO CS-38" /LENGTH=406 /DNA_ID=CAMNT_0010463047 /DNA_START=38 /DNA_END=1256 /DNA_ORIENTATION=+